MKPVDNSTLQRWRSLDASAVLEAFADYAKRDDTFRPRTRTATTRWHASVFGHEVELLLTGSKFFDTREGVGGGGAVDLVMHLAQVDFRTASRLLRERQL